MSLSQIWIYTYYIQILKAISKNSHLSAFKNSIFVFLRPESLTTIWAAPVDLIFELNGTDLVSAAALVPSRVLHALLNHLYLLSSLSLLRHLWLLEGMEQFSSWILPDFFGSHDQETVEVLVSNYFKLTQGWAS